MMTRATWPLVFVLGMSALGVRVARGAAQPVEPPSKLVSQEGLMAWVRSLPTSRAAQGDENSKLNLLQTEQQLAKALREMGYQPVLQEFKWALPARHWNDGDGKEPAGTPPVAPPPRNPNAMEDPLGPPPDQHTWHNIIVEIPGKELPGEVILIGAHFDAVPDAPGADDNGTGTAALLELAKVLKDQPMRRTVRLVFFNLEEVGCVGSSQYVKSLRPPKEPAPNAPGPDAPAKPVEPAPSTQPKIIGMVSLEMLGYFSDEPNSQKSPIPAIKGIFEPPTVGDGIALVGIKRDQGFTQKLAAGMRRAAPDLKLTVADFLPVPVPDMTRSDHGPFMLAGIPAVMLTDTANFRNPNYHKPSDTIETLDPVRFTLVVRALAGAVYELAGPIEVPETP